MKMPKWLYQSVASLIILLALGLPAAALEILYPVNGSYVTRSDALVIKAGEGVDGLVLEIGGVASDLIDISGEEYRALFQDLLIVEPFFDPGQNRIRVTGYRQGEKVAEARSMFYYQAKANRPPPEGYQAYTMHQPEHEAACVACHDLSPTQEQLDIASPAENPCTTCHRGMFRNEWVHGPAGAYQCGYCHDVQNEKGRFRERKIHADLCNECHQDIVETYQQSKYVHGPVAVGMCNLCHDSHASPHEGQLVAAVNDLCLGCHEGMNSGSHVLRGIGGKAHPLSGVKDLSRSRELNCTGCHNPHGGNSPYFFQRGVKTRMQLCQICHQK